MDAAEPEPVGEIPAGKSDLESAWRRYGPGALRFATALVGPNDAHDVTSTAFLRVTQRPEWREFDDFAKYLARAVRNEAHNLYRQRKRRWERDFAGVREQTAVHVEPDLDLLRAIAALTVPQRSVVFLAYWQDQTEAEIASQLDLSRGTVHRTLVRARAALRKAMK